MQEDLAQARQLQKMEREHRIKEVAEHEQEQFNRTLEHNRVVSSRYSVPLL